MYVAHSASVIGAVSLTPPPPGAPGPADPCCADKRFLRAATPRVILLRRLSSGGMLGSGANRTLGVDMDVDVPVLDSATEGAGPAAETSVVTLDATESALARAPGPPRPSSASAVSPTSTRGHGAKPVTYDALDPDGPVYAAKDARRVACDEGVLPFRRIE